MIATALILLTVVSFMAACGGKNAGGGKRITFMYSGDTVQMERYKTLIDSYNATAGKEAGITVVASPKPSGLESLLPSQLPSDSSPDVVALWDRNFKLYIEYYQDLTDYINEETISAVYPNSINRYRYNPATTTSNPEDPLYGVTMYNDATVLYYTVDESMLRFWNDENKFQSEPGKFHLYTGYADHLLLKQDFTLR